MKGFHHLLFGHTTISHPQMLHIGGVSPEVIVDKAGTILHCIVSERPLLSISVGCHLVSALGTVGLMKQHVFPRAAPKLMLEFDKHYFKT